jgi:cell division protein ZapA (FtsZ GTPase activity inhibitor)
VSSDKEFDAQAVSADLARLRAKLRQLDAERQQTVEQLEQALHRAQRRLPPEEEAAGEPE